jgi:hypothetical protein
MLAQAAFMAAAGALLVLGVAHFVSTGAATAPADATGAWHGVQQAIAWSYRSALDPAVSLAASFAAYTLGVGLVAGVMKAAPLLLELRTENDLSWRGAAAMGMGAGAAFGVVEAVMYCMHHLNGIEPAAAYQAVFASSVAVHGCCGAAAALALHARQDVLQTHGAGAAWALHVLRLLAAPVVLQGMYDTLLKRGMHGGALLAGAGALAWFAWHLESSRTEAARAAARAH